MLAASAAVVMGVACSTQVAPTDGRPLGRLAFRTANDGYVPMEYVLDGLIGPGPAARVQSTVASPTTSGQETVIGLSNLGPVTSFTIDATVEFDHRYGLVRVVLVDSTGHEYLVYETYPSLEAGEATPIQVESACEETCHLDRVTPVELRLQAIGARLVTRRAGLSRNAVATLDGTVRRREQNAFKAAQINAGASTTKLAWRAEPTDIANLTYWEKRRMFLGWKETLFLPNLQGLDFYKDGTFDEVGPRAASAGIPWVDDNMNCGVPNKVFDWRARHGRDYMTPVKNQGACGSCWAFAAVGAAEARINTFYNQLLGINLAEQDSVCVTGHHHYEGLCALLVPTYAMYADGCNGGEPQGTFEVLTASGLPLTANMPYLATDDPTTCASARSAAAGTPRWQALGIEGGARNEPAIKNMLSRGPVTVCLDAWSHCIVIAGYEEYACGTRWILKNSWGAGWGQGGYVKARLDLGDIGWQSCGLTDVTLRAPTQVVPMNGVRPSVVCEDRDNDRYCNWGTGPKPSTCPAQCFGVPDDDDTVCNAPTCSVGPGLNCGTITTGCGSVSCGACPSGQVCLATNSCCTPMSPVRACGTQCVGTVSDGCNGTVTCTAAVCRNGASCVAGECVGCPTGYKDCGGMCVRSNMQCP